MLLASFFPVFVYALTFFVLMLQLVDLFPDLVRYLDSEVPATEILRVQLLYTPKAVSYALPMSLLFAVSFTLGSYYSNNELIAVFGSGTSLYRFVLPILALGMVFGSASFFFEEHVVIDTLEEKGRLSRQILNANVSFSNTNVTVMGESGRLVYHADYYNDATTTLSELLIVERDEIGAFVRRIDAEWAEWNGSNWELNRAKVFAFEEEVLRETQYNRLSDPVLTAKPSGFRRKTRNVDEMRLPELREWIATLRASGQPFREALTKYYERYSFALTPFIVVLISSAIGGRFKKNILLMSLLVSLSVSVVYYVIQMIGGLMAYSGYISPLVGAWSGFALFSLAGVLLFRLSRT
jgi:lipopolysaccharide export system permease protein